ncbi:hypothetical protein BD626DRAFT_365941, partial [Schizophyllum amplum]
AHAAFLKQFAHKGRIFGRYCNMFDPIINILQVGIARDINAPRSQFTKDNNFLYDAYYRFVSLFPDLLDIFDKLVDLPDGDLLLEDFANAMTVTRNQSRSDDVKGTKFAMSDWSRKDFKVPHPGGNNKGEAGYHHVDCARLIAPTNVDPVDEEARLKLVRLETPRSPDSLCRVLYENENFRDRNAFLKHPYLVTCYKHIFCGPSSALEDAGETGQHRQGNGDKHNIKEVSLQAIAYCACLVHFALSSQINFNYGGSSKGWQYGRCDSLLSWWNERVYADCRSYTAETANDSAARKLQDEFRAEAEAEAR